MGLVDELVGAVSDGVHYAVGLVLYLQNGYLEGRTTEPRAFTARFGVVSCQ
jgi:hypothetical protein